MAKKYTVGDRYYLPVTVSDVVNTFIKLAYLDGVNNDSLMINDMPDLLLTADEIATDINTERAEIMESLGKQNLELSKQNEELSARVEELTGLLRVYEKRIDDYMAERRLDKMNIRLLLDKIAEVEGKNG